MQLVTILALACTKLNIILVHAIVQCLSMLTNDIHHKLTMSCTDSRPVT